MAHTYNIKCLNRDNFDLWDSFVDESPQGTIFNKTWWLDSVATNYKLLVCEDGNSILGGIALPCSYSGFYRCPLLTPMLGILLKDLSFLKQADRLTKEMEIIGEIVDHLPSFKLFDVGFHYSFNNYLPFIWRKFEVKPSYSYVLFNINNISDIPNNYKANIKSDIKKATRNDIQIIEGGLSINDFYDINKMTFDRQNIVMPYSLDFILKLDKALELHDSRKILFAIDKDRSIHAAAYIVYDNKSAYYLMSGGDPKLRNSGATSLLIHEAIKISSQRTNRFDFEGSMIPNVERFFRSFGGNLSSYARVSKSPLYVKACFSILRKNKNLLRKIGLLH